MSETAKVKVSITKEQISSLPRVEYPGIYEIVENAEQEEKALNEINSFSLVGFDTETKPSFKKGQHNKVSLVQISTGEKCYLFRVNKLGLSQRLKDFFGNAAIKKIGLSIKDDFYVLKRIADFDPSGFIDLQEFVCNYSICDASLQKIYAILFGERISKSQRLSNWEADTLTDGQKNYASIDAWACLKIYLHLTEGNFDPMNSPYIITESEE